MLDATVLDLLRCPLCGHESLGHEVLEVGSREEILVGVVWCSSCRCWFPVEDGLLDMLVGGVAYREDRARFYRRHQSVFERLELAEDRDTVEGDELQVKQQAHFDWYAANEKQSYLEYEQMPFWVAIDALTFAEWRPRLQPGGWLLDVGCGNGRGTFKVMDLALRILAFDVTKGGVRQAQERYRERRWAAQATFFTADATRFPIKAASMDHVLVYGVLHHVPDPSVTCREIARVLKPGGLYLGSENNTTIFRSLFELLQKLRPLWYEEAGPEALISSQSLREAFRGTGVELRTRPFTFVPPHVVNLLPPRVGERLLRWTDRVAGAIPGLRDQGGLILVEGEKPRGEKPVRPGSSITGRR